MNATTENQLFNIWIKIARKTSSLDADRIIEPIKYYIETGRCSGSFVRTFNQLTARQLSTIANRLIKFDGMDYEGAIQSVVSYVIF